MRDDISGHQRHQSREDLAGEYRYGDLGQIIFLIVFLIVWITDSFVFNYSNFISDQVPSYAKILLGSIAVVVSGYLAKAGLSIVFGEVREQACVIRKSVFGIVRHPIYLGSILLYLGLVIFTLSIASAILWIVIVLFYHFISKHEEKLLLAKYGGEYSKYTKEVPMWIPRLRRK